MPGTFGTSIATDASKQSDNISSEIVRGIRTTSRGGFAHGTWARTLRPSRFCGPGGPSLSSRSFSAQPKGRPRLHPVTCRMQ